KTPMKRRSKASLASSHYLDPMLHRRFTDRYRRLTTLSPVHVGSAQFLFHISEASAVHGFLMRLAGVLPML
ncbi:hypothetical protein HAX54_049538, partial [Datura stramonium]|nr:hypothetical protein [Datura stramonium]